MNSGFPALTEQYPVFALFSETDFVRCTMLHGLMWDLGRGWGWDLGRICRGIWDVSGKDLHPYPSPRKSKPTPSQIPFASGIDPSSSNHRSTLVQLWIHPGAAVHSRWIYHGDAVEPPCHGSICAWGPPLPPTPCPRV